MEKFSEKYCVCKKEVELDFKEGKVYCPIYDKKYSIEEYFDFIFNEHGYQYNHLTDLDLSFFNLKKNKKKVILFIFYLWKLIEDDKLNEILLEKVLKLMKKEPFFCSYDGFIFFELHILISLKLIPFLENNDNLEVDNWIKYLNYNCQFSRTFIEVFNRGITKGVNYCLRKNYSDGNLYKSLYFLIKYVNFKFIDFLDNWIYEFGHVDEPRIQANVGIYIFITYYFHIIFVLQTNLGLIKNKSSYYNSGITLLKNEDSYNLEPLPHKIEEVIISFIDKTLDFALNFKERKYDMKKLISHIFNSLSLLEFRLFDYEYFLWYFKNKNNLIKRKEVIYYFCDLITSTYTEISNNDTYFILSNMIQIDDEKMKRKILEKYVKYNKENEEKLFILLELSRRIKLLEEKDEIKKFVNNVIEVTFYDLEKKYINLIMKIIMQLY